MFCLLFYWLYIVFYEYHDMIFFFSILVYVFKLALTVTAPLWVFSLTFDLWWPPSQFSSTCLPRLSLCAWKNKSTNMSCHCSPLFNSPQCHYRLIETQHWIGTHSLSKCTGSTTQKPRSKPVACISSECGVERWWRWGVVIFYEVQEGFTSRFAIWNFTHTVGRTIYAAQWRQHEIKASTRLKP